MTGTTALGDRPADAPADRRLLRTAMVIGTGLIGTSVAVVLLDAGVDVYLSDTDPGAARTASAAWSRPAPGRPRGDRGAPAQEDGLARAYTHSDFPGWPRCSMIRVPVCMPPTPSTTASVSRVSFTSN